MGLLILITLALYAAIGLLFAVMFAFLGIHKVDPAARRASVAFRLLMIPGSAALWPVMLIKWLGRSRYGGL
jgi:hypothetical protein